MGNTELSERKHLHLGLSFDVEKISGAKFLDVIMAKVSRVFLLAINSHLY
jgi:hypothetical protein